MAPGKNDRHPSHNHTGTIPKTKVRNNCNVPQEVVTPTRRDMTSNLVSTSLDWVPVSEYNTRTNYNQASRKPTNNSSDHELTELDNSATYESGFGRFVPVRPQPRALPLIVQNRDGITEHHEDVASSSSNHTLHPYAQHMQNGLIPHSNHAAAAVMIVNPTTPNAVTGNISQPFTAPHQNRNNLTRNLNPARNNFDSNNHSSNNNITPPLTNSRGATKTVNLINNMYDQGQGSLNNVNDNHPQAHRDSARALGEAIVAACPDAAAVERRLGQIREYIRVTSSLVDTMRNSEDEAFIQHTKEEYDELVQMVMQLKESEDKLEKMLTDGVPDNVEVPALETFETIVLSPKPPDLQTITVTDNVSGSMNTMNDQDKNCNIKNIGDSNGVNNGLKKVTNLENEQLNKSIQNLSKTEEENQGLVSRINVQSPVDSEIAEINSLGNRSNDLDIKEIESIPLFDSEIKKDNHHLNEILRKNILSCVEKIAMMEETNKTESPLLRNSSDQDVVVRPVSVQSNGSGYSENELWQSEIKNKMELSQVRLAALNQQRKRLLKYQEEASQQLEAINKERQEIRPSTSHDNIVSMQGQSLSGSYHSNRMYSTNQIGVATTLPHSSDHDQPNSINNIDNDRHSTHSSHNNDDRFSRRDANISEEGTGGRDSEAEDDEILLSERGRALQVKLRELQLKKRHMENLVSEFQKLQMTTSVASSHNTYSSSGEDSADDEPSRKCNKSGSNIKNEDPFKLMEIKAIKAALEKTKDLMRTVEKYETDNMASVHDEPCQMAGHSNIHDNKSEGGGSMGGWSNDGSMCRVRNTLPQRNKFTNEQHSQQQSHEAKLASLQDLAQELRLETEKIMSERARIKEVMANKELASRKAKKVNSEPGSSSAGAPGPAERRQLQLRALLADKQRELEALLTKQTVATSDAEAQQMNESRTRTASIANHSYNSDQEEPDSRSEQILIDSQNIREVDNFRGGGGGSGDSGLVGRSVNTLPSHLGSTYASDSDSASMSKCNQRSRARRKQSQDLQSDSMQPASSCQMSRLEPRSESNVNMVPPTAHADNSGPYSHLPPPPCWAASPTNKSNQDVRTNQFTQNSHSQTMDRLLSTPQMNFPPQMPFNMMMPYGMVGGCGCGCGLWAAWCWQQLALQQREVHQLRDQVAHLEERWRAEHASHTLNNQVPPGNRANNYWDNFRSYSRQNLLSGHSKANSSPAGAAPPLAARSHNALRRAAASAPSPAPVPAPAPPKRNTDAAAEERAVPRRAPGYERSLSFSSAPDVLNVNQAVDAEPPRNDDVNLNRHDPPASNPFRNLNVANPIPELIQSHSNNLAANTKKKSSSKLPAKNSTNRRNYNLDYSQTSNVNVAGDSETPNPNLASTSRVTDNKATSKLFDLLRENVYSEVTALIGVNESHPDFLIQLFRELQMVSSDPQRQKVLQSIRTVLAQYDTIIDNQNDYNVETLLTAEAVSTTADVNNYHECNSMPAQSTSSAQVDNNVVRFLLSKGDEICTPELLDALANHILGKATDSRQSQQMKKKLLEIFAKYEGMRMCDVTSDMLESLPLIVPANEGDESTQLTSELSESSILQDVAGSLNLFGSNETQLHQVNCPYEMWPGHVHMDIDGSDLNEDHSARSSQEGKMDLINCSEMQNGDLAEADQTHEAEAGAGGAEPGEALPDVVEAEDAPAPPEAEAEWLGLDRVPTRLHMAESSEKQEE